MTARTFIIDNRYYEVLVSPHEDLRSAVITLTLDSEHEWSLLVAGWRGVSLGVSGAMGYLWSARELVTLPHVASDSLQVVSIDEDAVVVFRIDGGWLVVCETSVRLIVDDVQTARVELREVVDAVRLVGDVLIVRDAAQDEYGWRVEGQGLIEAPDAF